MVDERIPAAVFSVVFLGLLIGGLYAVLSYWGLIDAIGVVFGVFLGVMLMPAMATPFFPSPPKIGGLLQQFMKIYMTIASMILGASVFYLTGSGQYVRKRLHIDGDTAWYTVDGKREIWSGAKQRLVSFGRRPLGLAWSEDHPMYQEIVLEREVETDGGEPATLVNMDRLHRMLRGVNQTQAIDAAVKDAKEAVGGGQDGIGQRRMMIAIVGLFITGFGLVVWAMG